MAQISNKSAAVYMSYIGVGGVTAIERESERVMWEDTENKATTHEFEKHRKRSIEI